MDHCTVARGSTFCTFTHGLRRAVASFALHWCASFLDHWILRLSVLRSHFLRFSVCTFSHSHVLARSRGCTGFTWISVHRTFILDIADLDRVTLARFAHLMLRLFAVHLRFTDSHLRVSAFSGSAFLAFSFSPFTSVHVRTHYWMVRSHTHTAVYTHVHLFFSFSRTFLWFCCTWIAHARTLLSVLVWFLARTLPADHARFHLRTFSSRSRMDGLDGSRLSFWITLRTHGSRFRLDPGFRFQFCTVSLFVQFSDHALLHVLDLVSHTRTLSALHAPDLHSHSLLHHLDRCVPHHLFGSFSSPGSFRIVFASLDRSDHSVCARLHARTLSAARTLHVPGSRVHTRAHSHASGSFAWIFCTLHARTLRWITHLRGSHARTHSQVPHGLRFARFCGSFCWIASFFFSFLRSFAFTVHARFLDRLPPRSFAFLGSFGSPRSHRLDRITFSSLRSFLVPRFRFTFCLLFGSRLRLDLRSLAWIALSFIGCAHSLSVLIVFIVHSFSLDSRSQFCARLSFSLDAPGHGYARTLAFWITHLVCVSFVTADRTQFIVHSFASPRSFVTHLDHAHCVLQDHLHFASHADFLRFCTFGSVGCISLPRFAHVFAVCTPPFLPGLVAAGSLVCGLRRFARCGSFTPRSVRSTLASLVLLAFSYGSWIHLLDHSFLSSDHHASVHLGSDHSSFAVLWISSFCALFLDRFRSLVRFLTLVRISVHSFFFFFFLDHSFSLDRSHLSGSRTSLSRLTLVGSSFHDSGSLHCTSHSLHRILVYRTWILSHAAVCAHGSSPLDHSSRLKQRGSRCLVTHGSSFWFTFSDHVHMVCTGSCALVWLRFHRLTSDRLVFTLLRLLVRSAFSGSLRLYARTRTRGSAAAATHLVASPRGSPSVCTSRHVHSVAFTRAPHRLHCLDLVLVAFSFLDNSRALDLIVCALFGSPLVFCSLARCCLHVSRTARSFAPLVCALH